MQQLMKKNKRGDKDLVITTQNNLKKFLDAWIKELMKGPW